MGIDSNIAIDISNIEIKYGNFSVIKDFSLQIPKGEIVTLFGPSGCGKSTILKAVLNQIQISSGSILIDCINSNSYKKSLAYTPQTNELLPWKTVLQNIELWYNDTIETKMESSINPSEALEMVELSNQQYLLPSQLSGGMERRTALARCISTNSEFILLDEAFIAVERRLRRKLMVDIRNHIKTNKMTALIISHDVEEAVFMSDRIIKLLANPTEVSIDYKVELQESRNNGTFDSASFAATVMQPMFVFDSTVKMSEIYNSN